MGDMSKIRKKCEKLKIFTLNGAQSLQKTNRMFPRPCFSSFKSNIFHKWIEPFLKAKKVDFWPKTGDFSGNSLIGETFHGTDYNPLGVANTSAKRINKSAVWSGNKMRISEG